MDLMNYYDVRASECTGTASRQRGRLSVYYDFDFSCTVLRLIMIFLTRMMKWNYLGTNYISIIHSLYQRISITR